MTMHHAPAVPRVLSIAGSDPSGGAGVQADLKTIAAHGGYGMAVLTALTAQNTHGVRAVHLPPPAFLQQQLDAISDDIEIDAVKIGMLGDSQLIDTVGAWLERVRPPIIVLDPVMVATSGDQLLTPGAIRTLRGLLPLADVITPNVPELAMLADETPCDTVPGMIEQASRVSARYCVRVLAKGGHLRGDTITDVLIDARHERVDTVLIDAPRVRTTTLHGTGCSQSSAIATLVAGGLEWPEALRHTRRWLTAAISHGAELRVGTGNGPIDHMILLRTE